MADKSKSDAYLEEIFGAVSPKKANESQPDTATKQVHSSPVESNNAIKTAPVTNAAPTKLESIADPVKVDSIVAPTKVESCPNESAASLTLADFSPPESSANKSHVDILMTMKDSWMLRHCDSYREELKSCKSIRGRFHQFYVHGKALDCSEWENSFDDCKAWNSHADEPAARRVIQREKVRIGKRLKAHYDNDVWEKRQSPPPDWQKPLPKWIQEKNENSFFEVYAKEKTKEENATVSEATLMAMSAKVTTLMPSCSIM